MNFNRNLPIEEMFDLSLIQTSAIADVLVRCGIGGVLDSAIVPLNEVCEQSPMIGFAYTVRWKPIPKFENNMLIRPQIWNQINHLLSQNSESMEGKIYVGGVDGGLLRSLAIGGGFSATHFCKAGMRGMVLGGAVRDANVVKNIPMPIWGTNFTPADSKGIYEVAEIGTSCTLAGLEVSTGDLIVADASGVTVIPQEKIFEVLTLATEFDKRSPLYRKGVC